MSDVADLKISTGAAPSNPRRRKPKYSPFTEPLWNSYTAVLKNDELNSSQKVTRPLNTKIREGEDHTEIDRVKLIIRTLAYRLRGPDGESMGGSFYR